MRRVVHTFTLGRHGLNLFRLLWLGATVLFLGLGAATVDASPLDTEDTKTLEPGQVELELRGDYEKSPDEKEWSLTTTLNIGVFPGLEVDVDAPFVLLDPEDDSTRGGVGDVELTTKYRLLDETERRPAFMGAVVLRLPTGDEDRGLGEEGVDVLPLAVVSKTFGPLTLTLNGGYTFVTRDRDLDFWVVTGSFEYEITDAWSLVGEIVSELGTHDRGDVVVLRAGTVLAITEGIEVYTAVGFGLTRDSPDVTVRLGVTIALF